MPKLSADEEIKEILASIDSDDSVEKPVPKDDNSIKKTLDKIQKHDDDVEWETNTLETPDSEW